MEGHVSILGGSEPRTKQVYGVTKNGRLYNCLMRIDDAGNETKEMVPGSYQMEDKWVLNDIAYEVVDTVKDEMKSTCGKQYTMWKHNVTNDMIRGTFKWIKLNK